MAVCSYCGAISTLSTLMNKERIPACRQCLGWLGSRNLTTVSSGKKYVAGRLENQLRKARRTIWSQGSADMMGPNLRSAVIVNTTSDAYFEALETRIRFAKDL